MKDLIQHIRNFNEGRRWDKYHDPRSLILAICGEVGELAQLFRWRRRMGSRLTPQTRQLVETEIADVLIFLLTLCIQLNIDPEAAVLAKLQENERRFPASEPESTIEHG